MGAGNSHREHLVEVIVEKPEGVDPNILLFVRLHSAADGSSKYRAWGEPQTLGLLADDIITVSFFCAESERDFDKLHCEEFAEVYLPWVEVGHHVTDQLVSLYDLGIRREDPWLGPKATPAKYRLAFARAYHWAKNTPSQPRFRVGIRLVPRHCWDREQNPPGEPALISAALNSARGLWKPFKETPTAAASSPAVVCSMTDLTPEEEAHIAMLQKQNEDLRLQLGMQDADDGPAVHDQVQEHLEVMRREVSENYALRAQMQAADKELAILHASLSKEQHMAIGEEAEHGGPAGSGEFLQRGDEADLKRISAEVFEETKRVTRANVELITQYEQKIKALEEQLIAMRHTQVSAQDISASDGVQEHFQRVAFRLQRQEEELEGLEGECGRLQDAITHEIEGPEEERSSTMQQLIVEHEVQNEEIGRLEQMMQHQVCVPPMTGQLRETVTNLEEEVQQSQQRCADQRQAAEQHADWLRRETLDLQQQLQAASEDKEVAAAELDFQRATPGMGSAVEHEISERGSLDGELSRLMHKIEVFDEKIKWLIENAPNIQERASQVLSAVPERTGSHDPDVLRAEELERAVDEQQFQLELLRIDEAKLEEEHEKAKRALEAAKADSGHMERRSLVVRAHSRLAHSRRTLQAPAHSP